jgi:hypothetical protein
MPSPALFQRTRGTMSILSGSGLSKDLKRTELERHLRLIKDFLSRVERGEEPASVTMIVRSPCSAPARVLTEMGADLARAGVAARVVLAWLEPDAELKQLFAALSALSPQDPAIDLIRWARNPRLLDAHEQAALGESICWSGDAMRREADKKNAFSLFYENAPERTRLARLAFAALWQASMPIPERRLVGRVAERPSGAYEPGTSRLAAMSLLRAMPQGWPLVRH